MKKTKLNIALTDIMSKTLSDEIDGSPNSHIRRDLHLEGLRKEHHDEFSGWVASKPSWVVVPDEIMAGLAERLRDFGKTATGRARSEWSPSLDYLQEYSARASDRAALRMLRIMGDEATALNSAPASAISFKDLEQLALKCHELKERAPVIELGILEFFRVLATHSILYGSPGVCEFHHNGVLFRLNPGLPAGKAKVIENER